MRLRFKIGVVFILIFVFFRLGLLSPKLIYIGDIVLEKDFGYIFTSGTSKPMSTFEKYYALYGLNNHLDDEGVILFHRIFPNNTVSIAISRTESHYKNFVSWLRELKTFKFNKCILENGENKDIVLGYRNDMNLTYTIYGNDKPFMDDLLESLCN